jgi:predicted component of type VI protein secretion system
LCLRGEDDPRRLFVFLTDSISWFGRRKPTPETARPSNDLVLRLLPCRSEDEDRQNWAHTMAISGTHGGFVLRDNGLFLHNTSRLGLFLNGRKLVEEEKTRLPDVFILMLAGALRLRGRLFRPAAQAFLLDCPTDLRLPKPSLLDAAVRGPVDCLRLLRVINRPEDEYLFLYRTAAIGSSSCCPIHLPGLGVAPLHARLLRHRGMLLLACERGGLRTTKVDDQLLGANEVRPLSPGMRLQLGETKLRVEAATPKDLVTLETPPRPC